MYKDKEKCSAAWENSLREPLQRGGLLASYAPSFLKGGACDETAHADFLLLCCPLDFHLLLIGVVRGDRLPHHSGQLASSETNSLFLHERDGSTTVASSEGRQDAPYPPC
jgi:hypothetical protein